MLIQKIKPIIAFLLLSVLIFSPQIQIGAIKIEYFFSIIGFLFFIHDYQKNLSIDDKKYYLYTFTIISILFLLSLLLTRDFYYLKNFFVIFKFFFKAYLFVIIYKKYLSWFNPFIVLGISLIPYIFSIFFFQSNHEIATWWFNLGPNAKHNILFINHLRVSWLGGQTWDHSIYFTTIYFLIFSMSERKNFLKHLLLILIFLGAILSARTWIVTYVIAFVFILMNQKLKSYISLITHIISAFALTYFIYHFLIISELNFFRWIWEILFNLIGSSPEISGSVTDLNNQNLTFVQNNDLSLKTILFGDGKYAQIQDGIVRYYGGRDSGYIRELLCVGILFSGLLYLLYIFAILKSYTFRHHRRIAWFFIATLFIYQIKGDILFAYFGFFLFMDLLLKQRDLIKNEHI